MLSSAAHHVSAKLSPKFYDPFIIAKVLLPVTYELADEAGRSLEKIYVKNIKPYLS